MVLSELSHSTRSWLALPGWDCIWIGFRLQATSGIQVLGQSHLNRRTLYLPICIVAHFEAQKSNTLVSYHQP